MAIPVNLYVDRMSPVQPVRVADVYTVTQDRSSAYKEAASKIGLTPREYAEFRQDLNDGGALYVRLPRHIDAMAGIHRRNGQVYALRNVVVPSGTMGWQVNLADGTTVLVPRICGNLSMNRSHAIAQRPRPVAVVAPKQPKAVRAISYVAPVPAAIPETPVVFDEAAPLAVAAAPVPLAAAATHGAFPFAALLLPVIAAFHGGGGSPTATPAIGGATTVPTAPQIAPCSSGSTTLGVCSK